MPDTIEPPSLALLAGRSGMLVRLQAKPGGRAALLEVLNSYVDGLDEEPGTEFFMLSIDPEDQDIVWLYEIFTDDAAQEAHRASQGFAVLMGAMPDLLAQAPGILRINPLRLSLQNSLLRDDLPL